QQLDDMDQPWMSHSKATVKYERDKRPEDVTKEITIGVPHPDFQLLGYSVNEKRFPTFRYKHKNLTVEETFSPSQIEGREAIVRNIKFSGKAEENLYFLAQAYLPASAGENGWINAGNDLKIKIEGAEHVTRNAPVHDPTGDGNYDDNSPKRNELLIPVSGGTELKITYNWKNQISGRVK
ncbi:MAG: hypothetical protein AAF226_15130, partial [Verrucomicrobiota bacterium]